MLNIDKFSGVKIAYLLPVLLVMTYLWKEKNILRLKLKRSEFFPLYAYNLKDYCGFLCHGDTCYFDFLKMIQSKKQIHNILCWQGTVMSIYCV